MVRTAIPGWICLAAIPFLYLELPLLIGGAGFGLHDPAIQSLEARLFGTSPAATLAGALPWRPLSELLHLSYLSYYALIYLPPAIAFWRGDRHVFDRTVAGLTIAFATCFTIFTVFAVAGPRYLWPAPPGVPDGPVRRLVLSILGAASSRGAAFPSSHVAVSVVQTAMALRWQPRVGWAAAVATLLLSIGAVYGGFHYAVDVIAGGLVGVALACAFLYRVR